MIWDFDTNERFAWDWCFDTNWMGGEGEREVVGESGDAREFDAFGWFEGELGDGWTNAYVGHFYRDAEVFKGFLNGNHASVNVAGGWFAIALFENFDWKNDVVAFFATLCNGFRISLGKLRNWHGWWFVVWVGGAWEGFGTGNWEIFGTKGFFIAVFFGFAVVCGAVCGSDLCKADFTGGKCDEFTKGDAECQHE